VIDGARDHCFSINLRRQGCPQKESAARLGPREISRELAPQARHHHVALVLIMSPQHRRLPIEDAAAAAGVDDALIEAAGAEIGGLLGDFELRRERRGGFHPRHAIAGRKRFREAAEVYDAPGRIIRANRPYVGLGRGILEVEIAIRIVFDDQHVAAFGPCEQRLPFASSDQKAGWVLKVRNEVEDASPLAFALQREKCLIQIVERDPVALLPDADQFGLHVPERRDRARIRRQLDEHHVVRIEQDASDEIEPLLRAGGDEQPIGRRWRAPPPHDVADRFQERRVASRRAVLQHRPIPSGEQLRRDFPELVPGKRIGRGETGSERDDVAPLRRNAAHLADGGAAHVVGRP
jgi:hypothetical protein